MLLLRHLSATRTSRTVEKVPRPVSETSFHSFISGLAAGYYVFGRRRAAASSVNQQIVIYVFARVVLGAAKLAIAPTAPRSNQLQAGYGEVRKGGMGLLDLSLERILGIQDWDMRERVKGRIRRDTWAVFASLSWGAVMWLFRWHPDVLQPSLRGSMVYLYDRAEDWDGVKNWIWHNR